MRRYEALLVALFAALPTASAAQPAGKQKASTSSKAIVEREVGDCQFKLLDLSARTYRLVSESDSNGDFGKPVRKPLPVGRMLVSLTYTINCPTETALRTLATSRPAVLMTSGTSSSLFGRTTVLEGKQLKHDAETTEDFSRDDTLAELRLTKVASIRFDGLKPSK